MRFYERLNAVLMTTVGLGAMVYSAAEQNPALLIMAGPVWALGWMISLRPGGRPAPRTFVLAVVLLATALALRSIVTNPIELVKIISRYLLALQMIKLFDCRSARDKGQLLAMSVALCVGALLIGSSMWMGLALLGYLPALLWSLTLLQVRGAVEPAERPPPAPGGRRGRPGRVERQFAVFVAATGLCVIGLAAGVFVLMPRTTGVVVSSGLSRQPATVSGFNDEVRLGEAGLISESLEEVLTLTLERTGGPTGVRWPDTIYLRGAVLDEYVGGSWRRTEPPPGERGRDRMTDRLRPGQSVALRSPDPEAAVWTQHITVRNKRRPPLFGMLGAVSLTANRGASLEFSRGDEVLATDAIGPIAYTLVSQPDAVFGGSRGWRSDPPPIFHIGRVREEAERVLREAGLSIDPKQREPGSAARVAEAFQRRLQTHYEYTTEMIAPQAYEEPIEMFLFRTRRGHCEYFASAMAVLCRVAGLRAWVVTGYVATERTGAGTYVVRQSDAHAWVEVETSPGLWRTFDPSPSDDVPRRAQTPSPAAKAAQAIVDGMEDVWLKAVVGFSDRSRASIVGNDPLGLVALSRWIGVRSLPESPTDLVTVFVRAAARAGAAFAGAVVLGVVLRPLILSIGAAVRGSRRRRRAAGDDADLRARLREMEFYPRLLRTLARAGLAKPGWAPPLSHAQALPGVDPDVRSDLERLVGMYYAGRYGGRRLSPAELADARDRVGRVEAGLRGGRR